MIKQKSSMECYNEGDRNTVYYHSSLKSKNDRERIASIFDHQSEVHTSQNKTEQIFLDYFKEQIGNANDFRPDLTALDGILLE